MDEDPYLTILKRFLQILDSPMIQHAMCVRDHLRSMEDLHLPRDAELLNTYARIVDRLTDLQKTFVGNSVSRGCQTYPPKDPKPTLLLPNELRAITDAQEACKQAQFTLQAAQEYVEHIQTTGSFDEVCEAVQDMRKCAESYTKTLEDLKALKDLHASDADTFIQPATHT